MKPAARIGDMHTCPAATTVYMCACVGPLDTIIAGSSVLLIGGKPAAHAWNYTAHRGVIVGSCLTALIG
jgi:uncharacterized Zn-binding protein involved in type VI secretion